MAATGEQLDTIIKIVTPENIAFEYRIAGPFRRLVAYMIDLLVRALILAVFALAVGLTLGIIGLGGFGLGFVLVAWFLLSWFYGGLLETFWNGQTVGKRLLRLRVLTVDGQPINGMQAVMRNILRDVDSLPTPTYLLGLLIAMMNPRFQRLGDLACGTIVVREEASWHSGLTRVDDPAAIRLASEIPPGYEMSRDLSQALATYVERRRYFSPGRRVDIARHVAEPLREKLGLPQGTNNDLLLCALYHRSFITDQDWDISQAAPPPQQPFVSTPPVAVNEAPVIDVSN